LLDVISGAEEAGLQVNVTGDADVIDKLGEQEAEALLAALGQCLSNVLKHSGQSTAEVVVLAADDSVTATIIDSGIGFDKDGVAPDRLGMRHSVRGRIENVGGTVNLWTGNGLGTAVMLKVPLGRNHA
jgi:signal transduction histidine kinase